MLVEPKTLLSQMVAFFVMPRDSFLRADLNEPLIAKGKCIHYSVGPTSVSKIMIPVPGGVEAPKLYSPTPPTPKGSSSGT